MKILALQLKRIGDAVLTAPALAALRAKHPSAKITLLLSGAAGGLADAFSSADDVLVYKPGRMNSGIWSHLVTGGFTHVYDFTGSDRSALMTGLTRASERHGFSRHERQARAYTHRCDASVRNLHTLDYHLALTGAPAVAETGFSPPPFPFLGDAYTVVHPGTARSEKYWLPERWAEVIRTLKTPVLITGADGDEERAHIAAIERALDGFPVQNHAGKLSLLETAALIAGSRLTLSVDSAAAHFAAMAGVPQVALFGPTNPFHWHPRHPRAILLQAGQDAPIAPEDLLPKTKGAAMRELSTDAVIRGIGSLPTA